MSLFRKVEAETKVLKVAADKIYEFFKFRPCCLSNFPCPNIHGAELLLVEWGPEGCIVQWNYSYDGKAIEDKEMVEAIDDKNRSITWKMIEGHLLEFDKSFKAVIQVTPVGDEGCVVGFIMEYEKAHREIMDPNAKLSFRWNSEKKLKLTLPRNEEKLTPAMQQVQYHSAIVVT